jgi:hypothetical protein
MQICCQFKLWSQINVSSNQLKTKEVLSTIISNKKIMSLDKIPELISKEANLRAAIRAINVRGTQQRLITEGTIRVLRTTEELGEEQLENMKNTLVSSSNKLLRIFLWR